MPFDFLRRFSHALKRVANCRFAESPINRAERHLLRQVNYKPIITDIFWRFGRKTSK